MPVRFLPYLVSFMHVRLLNDLDVRGFMVLSPDLFDLFYVLHSALCFLFLLGRSIAIFVDGTK